MSRLDPGVELTTLPSSLRVVTHRLPHLESASLGIWIGSGTRHEGAGEHGISHFLEHMAFKGTRRRSARQIAEEIENVGGELNAATSHESTAYFARVLKADVGLALELLADMLRNPLLSSEEIEREREVILQEIASVRDLPEELVYELAEDAAFTGQPLGRTILGTEASVAGFGAAELARHLAGHYTADRMVLSAAGAVQHEAIVRHAEALFAGLTAVGDSRVEPARFVGGIRAEARAFEQSQVIVGFEGPSYLESDYYAVQVLAGLLGGGASSRLFQEVREERGLCYSIDAFAWGFADTGLLAVHSATGPGQVDELIDVVAEVMGDVIEHGPSQQEVVRTKAQLRAGLLMSLESTGARAEQLARQVLVHGRPQGLEELTAQVEAVAREQVRDLAARLFRAPRRVWSEVGPGADGRHAARFAGRLGPAGPGGRS